MESLEELQAILNEKPEGATDYSNRFNRLLFYKYNFLLGWFYWDGNCYVPLPSHPSNRTRSLADIQRIVDLMRSNLETKENTINEVINRRVAITETGMKCWIRVSDVELMKGDL